MFAFQKDKDKKTMGDIDWTEIREKLPTEKGDEEKEKRKVNKYIYFFLFFSKQRKIHDSYTPIFYKFSLQKCFLQRQIIIFFILKTHLMILLK